MAQSCLSPGRLDIATPWAAKVLSVATVPSPDSASPSAGPKQTKPTSAITAGASLAGSDHAVLFFCGAVDGNRGIAVDDDGAGGTAVIAVITPGVDPNAGAAAVATLASYTVAYLVTSFVFRRTREIGWMQLRALVNPIPTFRDLSAVWRFFRQFFFNFAFCLSRKKLHENRNLQLAESPKNKVKVRKTK